MTDRQAIHVVIEEMKPNHYVGVATRQDISRSIVLHKMHAK
ncbi:hypothetical protein ACVPOY_10165 [Staphylococcus aureus]